MQTTPLRVAMIAPIEWRTPPRQYGPREMVTSILTEGLVARGIKVTLFATGDSLTTGKLRAICPRSLLEDSSLDPQVWNPLHLSEVFERACEFDIIHCHSDFPALSYCGLVQTPLIYTAYEAVPARQLPIFHKYTGRATYIATSDSIRVPGVRYTATIMPGINLEDYRLNPTHGEYLLFVGRIEARRGLEEIIALARQSRLPLAIGGQIRDAAYFEKNIKPCLNDDNITYLGPVGRERRAEIFGRALALIHFAPDLEPFRLTLIESMACGTPVIALRSGMPPQIVRHRETGFLLDSPTQAIEVLDLVRRLDRRKIRQYVSTHFNRNRMVDDYLLAYQQAIQRAKARPVRPA